MSSREVSRFETNVEAHQGAVTRTESESFGSTLEAVVRSPSVGVPLGIPGVSLAETDVTLDPTVEELERAETGVTPATMGVADYGSIIVESTPSGTEQISLFVDHHVAVLRESDIVPDMSSLFETLGPTVREGGGSHVIATGPSATADMGELVFGAHGPRDVHVICLTDR